MKITGDINKIQGQDQVNDIKRRKGEKTERFNEILENQKSRGGEGTTETRPTDKGAAAGDSVRFSSEADKVKLVQDAVAATPDIRQDRVAEIKARIQAGTYDVTAEELAQKLIDLGIADKLMQG